MDLFLLRLTMLLHHCRVYLFTLISYLNIPTLPKVNRNISSSSRIIQRILGLDGKTELDTDILRKFGDLITGHSIDHYFSHGSIYDRLAKTWKYLLSVQDNDVPQVITGRSSASSSPPSLNLDRLQAATKNSSLMFKTVIERNQSINNILLLLDISTVLLIIIIRSQAMSTLQAISSEEYKL